MLSHHKYSNYSKTSALTKKGVDHSYSLGKQIRQNYNLFIDKIEIKNHLTIFSTNVTRTIETAFFVVKGLLNQELILGSSILDKLHYLYSFNYKRKLRIDDIIFGNSCYAGRCPTSSKIFNDLKNEHYEKKSCLQISQPIMSALNEIFPNFEKSPDYFKLFIFYDYIHMCHLNQIKMPENCSEDFEKELTPFSFFFLYDLFYSNQLALKLQNHFFYKLFDNLMLKMNTSELILCSLHDDNLYSFILGLGFNIQKYPEPCSLFTVEEYFDHSSNKQYFRFLFDNVPFKNEESINAPDNTFFDLKFLIQKIELGMFTSDNEFANMYGKAVNVDSWYQFINEDILTGDLENEIL